MCMPLMRKTANTLKKPMIMKKTCKHGVWLDDSENEQWQELVSKREQQKMKKANQASLLSVESSHNLKTKETIAAKDRWVNVRATVDS